MKDVDDEDVERLIAENPNGMRLEAIGQAMGLTRTRVAQILAGALAKCHRVATRRGLEAHDFPSRETTWDRMEQG